MQYIEDYSAFLKYIYQHCHCINAGQSKEERRLKYAIVRALGKDYLCARALRDWTKPHLAQFFGYSSYENLLEAVKELINA